MDFTTLRVFIQVMCLSRTNANFMIIVIVISHVYIYMLARTCVDLIMILLIDV